MNFPSSHISLNGGSIIEISSNIHFRGTDSASHDMTVWNSLYGVTMSRIVICSYAIASISGYSIGTDGLGFQARLPCSAWGEGVNLDSFNENLLDESFHGLICWPNRLYGKEFL